jgi:putative peptide zinc metalloprotease protein
VPLLLGDLGYAMWNLPRILSTGTRSLTETLAGTGSAFLHGQITAGLVGVIGSLMLVLPLAGMTYLSVRLTGRLVRALRRASEGNRMLRVGFCAAGAALVGGLCLAWVIGLTPKPLPPQPPIIPALQPGVATAVATTSAPSAPSDTGTATAPPRQSASPGALPSMSGTARPSGSADAASTSAPAVSAGPSTPAVVPSASATTNGPQSSATPSASGTAPASGGGTPTETPTTPDPSATPSTTGTGATATS